jgi:hypothetical protein
MLNAPTIAPVVVDGDGHTRTVRAISPCLTNRSGPQLHSTRTEHVHKLSVYHAGHRDDYLSGVMSESMKCFMSCHYQSS